MANPRFDVTPFLDQTEGQHFDRKSMFEGPPGAKRSRSRREMREQVAEYVAAFANADGGVLLLGVEDDGSVRGHRLPPKAVESLLAAPRTRLDPPQPRGFTVFHEGVELIAFDVPAEDVPVQMTDNGFPLRVGDQTVRARETQIAAAKQQGMYESWESRRSACSLEDLDLELLARARSGAGLSALSDEEYLLKRKLADQRGRGIVLRRAAELLFARLDPDHPNAGVRVFRVIGTERRFGAEHNVEERPRIEGGLPGVLDEAHGVVAGLLRRPSRLVGMRFQEMPEYPDFAWREALHNAVAHRDYAIQGSGIEIWLFEDRMEVVSAGGLPEGVSLDDVLRLERVHRSRNPRIVRVLVDLGYAKDQGEGIPRMFAEMEDAFLPRPEVEVRGGRVIVALRNTSTLTAADRRFVASLGDADLSRHEFRALLMAHRRGRVDNAAMRSVTGLDTLRASALLRGLRDRELLTLHARGGDSFYTLTPAVREHVGESLRGADRGELADGSGGASRADRGELAADRGELPADRGELPADRGELAADRGELPADRGELPADVRRAIDGLGSRPRKERLREVIEAICAARGWTTSGDIARFLHFSQRKLSGRHLTPMVEAGRLVRRYPANPTHPDQAYGAVRPRTPDKGRSVRERQVMSDRRETATLAGGCFWCLEAVYQLLEGVHRVKSGYAGGRVDDPTYEQVCTGRTGHAEVVRVTFDPDAVTFEDLLDVFFTIHDPTTLNRQGGDIGTQYRSAIFYESESQRQAAERKIAEIAAARVWPDPVVTEVAPLREFHPAEAYHDDYLNRNPTQPYCQAVVAPKVAKFRRRHLRRLKRRAGV